MIECVTFDTESRFPGRPLSQQFELRYDVCIVEYEWTGITVRKNMETGAFQEHDQYDTLDTEYLIKRDDHGRILGSIRIGPTTTPYMLKDHFAATVADPYQLPESNQHYELSRMAVNKDLLDSQQKKQVARELLMAAQERGLQRGIKAYWGIILDKVVPVFENAGYEVERTGMPVVYPNTGESIYGVKLPIREDIHRQCQQITQIFDPVLTFGHDKNGHPYPPLTHDAPMSSDDFFLSGAFQKATGRPSIHSAANDLQSAPDDNNDHSLDIGVHHDK